SGTACRSGCARSTVEFSTRSADTRIRGPARERVGLRRLILDDVMHRERRAGARRSTEADHAFARQLRAVAPHEDLLAAARVHERSVRALVDEGELVAARFDARVQPRDQIALDDEIVVLRAAERDALPAFADENLLALVAQAETLRASIRLLRPRHGRQHAGRLVGLPQHL